MAFLTRYINIAWRLLRPQTYILIGLHVLLAFTFAVVTNSSMTFREAAGEHIFELVVGLVLVGLWYINAAGINDLSDYEVDKINLKDHADRPLITDQSTVVELKRVNFISGLAILLLSVLLSVNVLALSILLLFLSWAYSMKPIRVSYRGFLAPLLLPLGYAFYPMMLGLYAFLGEFSFSIDNVLFIVSIYLLFMSRVMLKDFRDVKGDLKFKKMTFLLRHNARFVTYSSMFAHLLSTLIMLYIINSVLQNGYLVSALIIFISISTGYLFIRLSRQTKWKYQKNFLPYISRLKSIHSVLVLIYLIYLAGDYSYLTYSLISLGLIIISYEEVSKIFLTKDASLA